MSVDVTIKNRQFLKKPLSIKDVIMGKYAYGTVDEYGRNTGKHVPGDIVVYDPKKIGRGVTLPWNRIYKDEISIRLNHLCTKYDADMFYDIVRNIMHVWKTKKFEQDGNMFTEDDIENVRKDVDKSFFDLMADVGTASGGKNSDYITIFGVMYPLDLDIETIEKFGQEKDAEGYAEYLHNMQSQDAFYAVPLIYSDKKKPDSFFGAFAITSGTPTVLPIVPKPPIGTKNPKTGDNLVCDMFVASLFSYEKKKIVGTMKYSDFLEKADVRSAPPVDKTHVLLPGLSEKKMAELAEFAKENPWEE